MEIYHQDQFIKEHDQTFMFSEHFQKYFAEGCNEKTFNFGIDLLHEYKSTVRT